MSGPPLESVLMSWCLVVYLSLSVRLWTGLCETFKRFSWNLPALSIIVMGKIGYILGLIVFKMAEWQPFLTLKQPFSRIFYFYLSTTCLRYFYFYSTIVSQCFDKLFILWSSFAIFVPYARSELERISVRQRSRPPPAYHCWRRASTEGDWWTGGVGRYGSHGCRLCYQIVLYSR